MRRDTLSAKLWAEFIGTAFLLLLGDGVVANTVFASRLGVAPDNPWAGYDWNTIALGWAFAVVMAVYVAGGITGAHINPAVTAAAMARRTMDVTTGIFYWIVQVAGGFVGAFLVWVLYKGDFDGQGWKNVFYTGPSKYYDGAWFNLYFAEFVGTFMLVLLIYAIVDNIRNIGPGANLWPFMVGMAVLAIGLSLGGPTGYAINPARDLGPRLFSGIFLSGDNIAFKDSYFLVPIIAPLLGGVAGAFFYDFLVKPMLPLPKEPEPQPRGADVAHDGD
ncbi:MAG: MIP/aquaporin family protein [Thermomicrobiales bacterium]